MTVKEAHAKILREALKLVNDAVTNDADLPMQGAIFTSEPGPTPFGMRMEPTVPEQYIPALRVLAIAALQEALMTTEVDGKNLLAALIVGHAHQGISYFDATT